MLVTEKHVKISSVIYLDLGTEGYLYSSVPRRSASTPVSSTINRATKIWLSEIFIINKRFPFRAAKRIITTGPTVTTAMIAAS